MVQIDLSIVIVSYNVRKLLENCLLSIIDSIADSAIQYEIFVVDNNSRDNTVEMVETKFPQVKLIANRGNKGFAAANNQAIKLASGRYMLLLNPDTIIKSGAIQHVLQFFRRYPNAGIVGCKLLNGDGTLQPSYMSFPSVLSMFSESFFLYKIFPKSLLWGKPYMTYLDYDKTQVVEVVKGAFFMIRRDVIEQIGLLDEQFFIYTEETDWCYRANQAGWKVYYTPEAEVIHLEGGSAKQQSIRMFVELHKTKRQFLYKHYAKPKAFLINMITGIGVSLRAIIWGIVALSKRIKGSKSDAYSNKFNVYWHTTLWYVRISKSKARVTPDNKTTSLV